MSNTITLPPLPSALLISTEHGPFRDSMHEEGETYCARCKTRSIFFHTRKCDPHVDDDQLRARDLEVARVVLEFLATRADNKCGFLMAPELRNIEVKHHE
jgi:hypothetical protein